MSKTEPTRALQTAKSSFDPARNAWFCGKKPILEEEVLILLNPVCQIPKHHRRGRVGAESALSEAKATPELTTAAFVKACMVRNRNLRIAGKYLFQNWTVVGPLSRAQFAGGKPVWH
ncbi:MAG TPA: hypothetical protein O0X23_00345 [Methanocorpusculum sp.]|nr:hypothetical protein [Methanocorpusculum sp.]